MEKNGEKKNVVSRSALLHAQNKKKKKKEKVRACVLKRGVEPRTFRELNNISSF